MRILVIDKFLQPRSSSQMDMYLAMSSVHDVFLSADPVGDVLRGEYDLLYLGLYHQVIGVDMYQLLRMNSKPILVDQSDNEEFIERNSIPGGATFLSRYLPNEAFESYCKERGISYAWLPFYVNPDRFNAIKKDVEYAFICSNFNKRRKRMKDFPSDVFVGEFYGWEYIKTLGRARHFIIECSRQCMTQKYIEAALCECILVGDKPLYPRNDLRVYNFGESGFDTIAQNKEYILDTYSNKEWFLKHFNNIINGM